MYLHLGQEVVVRKRDIIGVFDLDNTTVSPHTKGFLGDAEKAGRVEYVSYELPKSFVVCSACRKADRPRQDKIYIAQMAPATLKKRSNRM
ncbi:MAG: DUF370 domain-containing protein [Clostridia bacterium]|nr:DUF370 domain-containing protein [Clostridia bacterium]